MIKKHWGSGGKVGEGSVVVPEWRRSEPQCCTVKDTAVRYDTYELVGPECGGMTGCKHQSEPGKWTGPLASRLVWLFHPLKCVQILH